MTHRGRGLCRSPLPISMISSVMEGSLARPLGSMLSRVCAYQHTAIVGNRHTSDSISTPDMRCEQRWARGPASVGQADRA